MAATALSLMPLATALARAVGQGWLPLGDNAIHAVRARDVLGALLRELVVLVRGDLLVQSGAQAGRLRRYVELQTREDTELVGLDIRPLEGRPGT